MNRKMKNLSLIILLFCILQFAAQKNGVSQSAFLNAEVFNEINGLPNNEVRCLLKDSKGYLWVGTIYGLAKYDGNKFSVFKHQSDKNSISGDVITAIFEDSKGNILVGANGLSVLNRKTGKWKNYLHNPLDSFSISSPNITSIAQENDSIFWIITADGINRFNYRNGKFSLLSFRPKSRIFSSKIHRVVPGERIVFSISNTLYRYYFQKNVFEEEQREQGFLHSVKFNGCITRVVTSDSGYNVVKLDSETGEKNIILKNVSSNGILFADESKMYFVVSNQVLAFDKSFNQVETYNFILPQGIAISDFNNALREENGTFWIATNNGLLKLSPNFLFQFIDLKNGLLNEYIRSILVDSKNNLWVGVRQGPIYKVPSIDDFLLKKSTKINTVKFPTPNGEVYATNQILELKNGNFLFVTNNTLYHYNTKTGRFTDRFQIEGNNQLFSAAEIDDGILIGSLERPTLFKILIQNNRIKRDTNFRLSNALDVVNTIFIDSNKKVWIGGDGLFYLDFSKDSNNAEARNVIPSINESNHSSNSVWDILEIDSDRLFVSTTTNGFYIFSRDSASYKHYSKANGFASDFSCSVLKAHSGSFWMTTKEGVTFTDAQIDSVKNFPAKNGQLNSDFTFKSGAKTQANFLLFGSKQGILFFNPDSIAPKNILSSLYVNEFRVFDNVVKRELTNGDTIVLNYNENFFSFEFSLLDFRVPQEISYSYQLVNFDKVERVPSSNFNTASYTDVPPGRYRFRLSAASADYSTNQKIEIFLKIKPAFYQTLWFKVVFFSVIALVIVTIVVSIVRRQILRMRLQKMELHLLRSQIDPHFIFNTLTSIQHSILTSSKDVAIDTLSGFSRLMRMSLDYSRLEYVSLEKAMQFYQTFVKVHSLNLDDNIEFNVTIDGSIDSEKVKISPMLIQPFLENAIVHGLTPKNKEMKIDFTIAKAGKLLECVIRDNGVGRKKAAEINQKKKSGHKSVGIEITRKSILAQLKKGNFIKESFRIEDNFDEQGNPVGTTVYLKIPFKE